MRFFFSPSDITISIDCYSPLYIHLKWAEKSMLNLFLSGVVWHWDQYHCSWCLGGCLPGTKLLWGLVALHFSQLFISWLAILHVWPLCGCLAWLKRFCCRCKTAVCSSSPAMQTSRHEDTSSPFNWTFILQLWTFILPLCLLITERPGFCQLTALFVYEFIQHQITQAFSIAKLIRN